MSRLGVMQGRLSPMIGDKIQAFPAETWRDEFFIARDLGLGVIEWVLDTTNVEPNPLLTASGRREIKQLQDETGIRVPTVCADYLMEVPLCSDRLDDRLRSVGMLHELIRILPEAGIKKIEIPLLGGLDINDPDKEAFVIDILLEAIPSVVNQGLGLLLEVGLPPERIVSLLDKLPREYVQINYDMGNSAYFSFNVREEMGAYGGYVGNLHIKDCTPEAYSVPLGKGNVDLGLVFRLLKGCGFQGDLILQTFRDPTRNPVEEIAGYMEILRPFLV